MSFNWSHRAVLLTALLSLASVAVAEEPPASKPALPSLPDILEVLGRGGRVSLVSDGGTPGISDPGAELVAAVIEGVALVKGAKNRDAAEQLIRYMMTPDIYKQMFKISTGYVYPAREWGWDQPEITESTYAQHVTGAWKTMP